MRKQVKEIIKYSSLIILGLYFLILGIYNTKEFLVPVIIASLLAMVMLPVAKKFETWGISKLWSVVIADLLILIFCVGIIYVIGVQAHGIATDWPEYKKRIQPNIEKIEGFVLEKTGISLQEQFHKQKEEESVQQKVSSIIGQTFSNSFLFLLNFILVFVYIFFFLFYRRKFFNSFLRFFSENKREAVSETFVKFTKVTQQYMFGRFLLILIMAALYAIGLSIIGIKHAIMVSILAAILSLIPYIGNVLGFILALFMAVIVKGGIEALIGVAIVFTVTQFIDGYFLEPYLIGHKVHLHPVLVILGVIAGGAIWGIAGTIIAMPVLGMLKVIFDSIPVLEPLGYFLGEDDTGPGFFEKIKDKIVKRIRK